MSEPSGTSPFAAKTIGLMLLIAILSFGAVVVLIGWSPELKNKNTAGDHPFSTSAIGYNGFVQLLEDLDYPVEISRLERELTSNDWGVMVITTSPYGMRGKLGDLEPERTTLFVLPKWHGRTDWRDNKKQIDTSFVRARQINDLLGAMDVDAELGRIDVPKKLNGPFGAFSPKPDETMQIVRSDSLIALVPAGDGALLAQVPGENTYILADPDMLNTFGLAEVENARFSIAMVDWLRSDTDEPIFLDATLHGFARSANLLQMAFDIPFIGATIAALATAFLLGWVAMVRFGPPAREGRVIALGKQALADNSAGLVSMARREVKMAPGYLNLIRKRVAKEISAPKTLSDEQLTALFDRLGPEQVSGKTYSQMEAGLRAPAADRADLMNKARELHRWRQDIIGRSTNERN